MIRFPVSKGFHAGELIKKITDGQGGGKPEIAFAGGKDPSQLNNVLNKAEKIIKEELEKK